MRLILACALVSSGLVGGVLLGGCASTEPGGSSPSPPSSTPAAPSSGPAAPSSGSAVPSSGSAVPTRLFANTQAGYFAAEPGVVLRSRAEVTRFAAWLRSRPRSGDLDDGVITALAQPRPAGDVGVAVAQNVGCSSVAHVSLAAHGTNLVLVPSNTTKHPECQRANVVVAVFAMPSGLAPIDVRINGRAPSTAWR
ncbi:MAG TPA: hypothetical protein VGL39_04570 [Jatrophihabitantaceae bacterium]|jgi:hypothetical protein